MQINFHFFNRLSSPVLIKVSQKEQVTRSDSFFTDFIKWTFCETGLKKLGRGGSWYVIWAVKVSVIQVDWATYNIVQYKTNTVISDSRHTYSKSLYTALTLFSLYQLSYISHKLPKKGGFKNHPFLLFCQANPILGKRKKKENNICVKRTILATQICIMILRRFRF